MSKSRKLMASEGVAIGALIALVMAEVIAFGGNEFSVSVVFGALQALFLVVLLASCHWARKAAKVAFNAPVQWLLFLGVLIAVAWGLTPFGPGGPHPAWQYLGPTGGSITVDRSALVLGMLRLCGLACLYLAAQLVGVSETRRRALVWCLLLALGVYSTLALIQHVSVHGGSRLAATLVNPNTAATLMGVCVVFSVMFVTQFIQRVGGSLRIDRLPLDASLSLGLAAVFSVTLALTASRAGIFSTVAALAVLLTWQVLAQGRKVRVVAMLGGAAALLVVIGVAMRSAELTATRLETFEGDVAVRQAIFGAHWEAFKSSPWFGFGLGSFPAINQLIMTTETLRVLFDVRATHNVYLQWLEETGVVGSLGMAALFAALIWRVGVGAAKPGTSGALSRATIAAAVLVLLHGLSDFALQVPALQAVFALGLGAMAEPAVARRPSWTSKPWPAPAFGGVVLVASLLVAIPMVAARFGGDLSAMPTAPAEVLATSIEAGLAKGDKDPASLARLRTLSQRELAMRPGVGSAWLRKAAVDFQGGELEAANVALGRSYAVAPLQTSLFMARTRIAYENWGALTPQVRQQVIYQASVEYGRGDGDRRLVRLANSIRNPNGQVALALLIISKRAAAKATAQ